MACKKGFEKTFILTQYLLKISGLPITNLNSTTLKNKLIIHFLYYFNMMFLYTDVAGQIFWYFKGVELGKSVIELSALAPCTAISILSTVKISFLYYNKKTVISAVNKLREIHPDDNDYSEDKNLNDAEDNNVETKRDNVERNIIMSSILLIKTTLTIQGILWIGLILCFSISPLVIMFHSYHTTGKYEYRLPVLIKYFFEIDTDLRWFFAYVHQIWSMFIVAINLFGTESLFIVFCIFIKMHFEVQIHHFKTIINPVSHGMTQENIKKFITCHQELMKLVKQLEILMSKSMLFQIVISSILLCLCMFNITFSENIEVSITFGTFLILILVQILLVNYFGDMLMTSSISMGDGVYDCLWYEADKAVMKDILYILLRTQVPCKISAGGYADLKLTTFTSILSTSWSYFALLKTMYD